MSLIETYQGRKSLFAQKLITKGVDASASDGLTTLINKIDDIGDGFTTGLLLSADKIIGQTNDIIRLTALLLKNGETVSGETVYFFSEEITPITQTYYNKEYYCYDVEGGGELICTGTYCRVIQGNTNYGGSYATGKLKSIKVEDSKLYINGIDITSQVSSVDFSQPYRICIDTNSTGIICTFGALGSDVTNNYGVATYDYTCTGAGEKTFFAKSGIFQSETYDVEDCFFVDDGTSSSTLSKYVWYPNDANTLQISNEALLFTCGTGQMYFNIDTNNSNWNISDFVGKTLTVKADVNPSRRMNVWINYQTSSGWSNNPFDWHSTSGLINHSREIPSDATRVVIRFVGGEQQGDTCIFDNLRFYFG